MSVCRESGGYRIFRGCGDAGTGQYPAAGERATTEAGQPVFGSSSTGLRPPLRPAPSPPIMNGKPNPAPTSVARRRSRTWHRQRQPPSIAAGPVAAQPQLGGTDNPPTEAARPRPAKPPKPPEAPSEPDPSAPGAAAAPAAARRAGRGGLLAADGRGSEGKIHGATHKGPERAAHHDDVSPVTIEMPNHPGITAYEVITTCKMPPSENPDADVSKIPPGVVIPDRPGRRRRNRAK